jgi:RimJ/RimL family protein N-acetyltransferase
MNTYENKIITLKNKHFDLTVTNNTLSILSCDLSDETIHLLTNWRKMYSDFFTSKFNISENRTKQWLEKNYISKNDRILFLLILNGKKIGHIGIINYDKNKNCSEIDNVLRGDRKIFPGIMKIALMKILEIGFDELLLDKFILKVFHDNKKAISLYKTCGFTLIDRIPLEKILIPDGWYWSPTAKNNDFNEKYHDIMQITKEQFKNTRKINNCNG